jgi:hypothetical protein
MGFWSSCTRGAEKKVAYSPTASSTSPWPTSDSVTKRPRREGLETSRLWLTALCMG